MGSGYLGTFYLLKARSTTRSTYPSALASNVLHRALGESAPKVLIVQEVIGSSIVLMPPANPVIVSPAKMPLWAR